MGGAFSILLSAFLLFTTICYRIAPESIIAEKKEYVKFFLSFFIFYFALDGITTLVLNRVFNVGYYPIWIGASVFILALWPILFIFHLLYPFKEVKRNQHLSFFLFFASLLSTCIVMFFILLGMSNM
jgi:hypothetical protein